MLKREGYQEGGTRGSEGTKEQEKGKRKGQGMGWPHTFKTMSAPLDCLDPLFDLVYKHSYLHSVTNISNQRIEEPTITAVVIALQFFIN
jgi:hypothetical protein